MIPRFRQFDILKPALTDLGIPLLLPYMEAEGITEPFRIYRHDNNGTANEHGTYGFYTDDYRFERIWDNPDTLINSGISTMIEPNFSIDEDDDPPVALFQLYRKRKLAHHAQSHGIKIYVDVYLPEKWVGFAFDGVPETWSHYATRGKSNSLDLLALQYDLACAHCNQTLRGDQFVVYGGGASVREWTEKHECYHLPEMMSRQTMRGQRKVIKKLPNGKIFEAWQAIPEGEQANG